MGKDDIIAQTTMIHPLVASNFEGVEIIMFAPTVVIAGLIGLLCAFARARPLALACGTVCAIVGATSLLFAIGVHGSASIWDFICGVTAIVIACSLFFIKRKGPG